MALIKCPECGTEVSDQSASCIKCGFPFNKSHVITTQLSEQQKKTLELLKSPKLSKKYICTNCGYAGNRKQKSNFSGCIFFLLLMLMILPAIIYAIVKSGKYHVCPRCDNKTMIPLQSDRGKELALNKSPEIFEKMINDILFMGG